MRKIFSKLFAALIAALAIPSSALAGVICTGPVNRIVGDQNLLIQLDWGWGNIKMCRLGSDMSYAGTTYTPENCRFLHTTALTAMGIGADIGIFFPDASTCAEALTNGQVPAFRWSFVHLITP